MVDDTVDDEIKPGSPDWNILEEMVSRLGDSVVLDAIDRIIDEDDED